MKKITAILATAAFALALAACNATSGQSGIVASGGTSDGSAVESTESNEPTVIQGEIAWDSAADAKAAAKDAGFSGDFIVPDVPPVGDYDWSKPNFTAMDNVAQADYDGKGIAISIRKGEGVDIKDLSADLNDYKYDWTQDVDGLKVKCHGYEKDIANFLEWEYDGCSYDVWCVSTEGGNLGMSESEVYDMVYSIK